MDGRLTDARFQSPEHLAGESYADMLRSKDAALRHLSAADYRVRLAAVLVCESVWNVGADPMLVEACRQIATSGAEDSLRMAAIGSLAVALSSTRAAETSKFLARIALDSANSMEVRRDAYWALRKIQFGWSDIDFDTYLKGSIHTIKAILRAQPGRFSEESVKAALVPIPPRGNFPEDFWDSADEIDWDFVRGLV